MVCPIPTIWPPIVSITSPHSGGWEVSPCDGTSYCGAPHPPHHACIISLLVLSPLRELCDAAEWERFGDGEVRVGNIVIIQWTGCTCLQIQNHNNISNIDVSILIYHCIKCLCHQGSRYNTCSILIVNFVYCSKALLDMSSSSKFMLF